MLVLSVDAMRFNSAKFGDVYATEDQWGILIGFDALFTSVGSYQTGIKNEIDYKTCPI